MVANPLITPPLVILGFTGPAGPAMADILNVTEARFGAVGDGIADDTAAIQTAFDEATAAGGGIVYFPSGTYLVTAQINIYGANITMRGAGTSTIIKAKDNAHVGVMFWVQSTADDFTADSFILDGNRDNLGTSGAYADVVGIICYPSPQRPTFRDIEVREVNSIGISIGTTVEHTEVSASFTRVYMHDNGMLTSKEGNGILLQNVDATTVTDCRFERNTGTITAGQYAGGAIVGTTAKLSCENCTFVDHFNGGGQVGTGNATSDLVMSWQFNNCRFALSVPDPHATNGLEWIGHYLQITNCEFVGHDARDSITIHGNDSTPYGRIIVTGNLFRSGYQGFGHSNTGEIQNILIANNTFVDMDLGVSLGWPTNPATNVIIANNDFSQNVTTTFTDGGCTNLVVLGNLPDTIGHRLPGIADITGDLHVGTNPGHTVTDGAIGLPNGLGGGIVYRNAANDGDVFAMHAGGDNALYLCNAHRFTATDAVLAGNAFATGFIKSTSPTAGVGYFTGAGDAQTQGTNITTTVVINKVCGSITTVTAPSIAAGAEAEFTVTNSTVAATDVVLVSMKNQFNDGVVVPYVKSITGGSFVLGLTNVGAAAVSAGTAVINFAVIKAVAS